MKLEEFAEKFPIGTPVEYYPVVGSDYFKQTKIRSEPWKLGHGAIVVKVEGQAGGVSIDHIKKGNGRPASPPQKYMDMAKKYKA